MVITRVIISLLLFTLLIIPSAFGQTKLEIIPLKNRLVEEVIPTIRSVLGKRGTVTGMHGQLIIRATPKALTEVKHILGKLDYALKNLRITVKQGTKLRLEEKERSITADIPLGSDGGIIIGSPDSGKLKIEDETSRGNIRARLLDKKQVEDEMDTQVVVTLEGRPALIYITQSFPVREIRNLRSGNTVTQVESLQFKNVRTGLRVLPRLKGEQVILEISPEKSRLKGEQIESFAIHTVVRGQIGEWMELGGIAQDRQGSNAGIGSRAATQKEETRKVFFKIDYQ